MKKILLIIFSAGMFYTSVFSQDVKPHFRSINTIGASVGESQPKLLFQTVNGFTVKDWFAGVGVGLDEYEIKSLPLFADIRWNFGEKKKGFIYGDIGYNFFLEDPSEDKLFTGTNSTYNGGIYTDVGIGIRANLIRKAKMVFTLGHSYKKMNQKSITSPWCFTYPCNNIVTEYKYSFGRINLKVGFEL